MYVHSGLIMTTLKLNTIRYVRVNNYLNILSLNILYLFIFFNYLFNTFNNNNINNPSLLVADTGSTHSQLYSSLTSSGHIYFRGPRWLYDYFSLGVFIIH